jgi:hypothetical protein
MTQKDFGSIKGWGGQMKIDHWHQTWAKTRRQRLFNQGERSGWVFIPLNVPTR